MAQDIGQKLRVTAAVLGTITRKDLALAFRRVNRATSFDVDRAHKWIQGRARPRELGLYEDWAKVVDLGRSGQWIADCDLEDFIEAACTRHHIDRNTLEQRIQGLRPSGTGGQQEPGVSLTGTYACYSHAWSPYFRGQLIRGEMAITRESRSGPRRLIVSYAERLPTGRLHLEGQLVAAGRSIYLDLHEPSGDAHLFFSLFLPTPPASVLAGFMLGATVIDPDTQPSVARIVIVRLPASSMHLRSAEAYLGPEASMANDLAALGLRILQPTAVEERLCAFMRGGQGGGLDQVAASQYRALVDVFDPIWLARRATTAA